MKRESMKAAPIIQIVLRVKLLAIPNQKPYSYPRGIHYSLRILSTEAIRYMIYSQI